MGGKEPFERVLRLARRLASLLIIGLLLGSGTIVNAQDANTPPRVLSVTSLSEEINGDVSNPDALLSDPGADGISLPEALTAVQADTGAHEKINFGPSLSGAVIRLSKTLI